ncbi:MAG: YdeI/OmpD-associated family protein [Brevinema sp.]
MGEIIELFFTNREEWRVWLEEYGTEYSAIDLVYAKKSSGIPSLIYKEALEEALCFGWIDSTVRSIDNLYYKQRFTPRKSISVWSKFNKNLVSRLIQEKRMHKNGYQSIDIAKKNGSWDILTDCYEHRIPEDLRALWNADLEAVFHRQNDRQKTQYLWLIKQKKRPESRAKAIQQVINSLKEKMINKI